MRNPTLTEPRSAVREILRDVLGDEAVESLTPKQLGTILGVTFGAARREIERNAGIPGQMEIDDGMSHQSAPRMAS
jgi:hypothetical protein